MKSKSFKNVIEVLPMKKGETLANVKTKVSLAHVPDDMTVNTDTDVLLVFLSKVTGQYLGHVKIVYSDMPIKLWGGSGVKRIANIEISELSEQIQDDAYVKLLNRFLYSQAMYGKFANYLQINRSTLSARMDSIVSRTIFKPMRQNQRVFEFNMELHVVLLCAIILILL